MGISWDDSLVQDAYNRLLSDVQSEASRARLLASAWKESGAWLNAVPVTSLGLRMEDKVLRIVELRIGAPLVHPHVCCHCGEQVAVKGTHSQSCCRKLGSLSKACLSECGDHDKDSAKIPSRLEPHGVLTSESKWPDGINLVPWKCSQSSVWDVT